MRIIITLIFCIVSLLCFGQSVFNLVGQTGVFAPQKIATRQSIYTSDVLRKMKFEDKFLYNNFVQGDTVTITDVKHIFPDKKKKEAILICFTYKGNELVYYIPFRYKVNNRQSFRNFIREDKYIHKFGGEIDWETKETSLKDIDVIFYNVDSIASFYSYFNERSFWPVTGKNTDKLWIQKTDIPYTFVSLGFKSGKELDYPNNRNLKTLHATFKEADGDFRDYEILPHNLTSLKSHFITLDEQKKSCETYASNYRNLIDSLLFLYKDKLIHIDYFNMPNSSKRSSYCITNNKKLWDKWDIDYFTLKNIECLPVIDNLPNHAMYIVIIDESSTEYAIPISKSIFSFIDDGISYKIKQQAQFENERKERELRELAEAEERINYEKRLARKYGKQNANLILAGKIRLGFTKQMVLDSWGNPSDNMTVTNSLGTVECWIYGLSSYVYFKSGKVVQIIN